MDSYKLLIRRSAEKELRDIPKPDLGRIIQRIQALSARPKPHGCEKLSGEEKYRIRQGDWRIVYEVDDAARVVEIFKIGHRREVYR